MPRQDPILSNFTGGEFSPSLYGRTDLAKYYNACKLLENYLIKPQGGAVRRPGTYYVADVKYHAKKVRLIPFQFSTTQAYILELGDKYIRFYMDDGQIQSGTSAYEIASPYKEGELFELDYAQSADVMYIVHPDHAPRKLTRTGHTSWTLSTPSFTANPFTGANKYPSCVEFFEQRLFFANSYDDPQKIWGSKSAEYENMTTGAGDDYAVVYTIAASKINAIRWLAAKDILLIGTVGGEWRLGASNMSEPITPTNVLCRRQSTYGSALVKPVTVGQATLFLQRARRKIREFIYVITAGEEGGYKAPDMTLLADHMTKSGIVDMAYQQEPDSILWCVLSNGYLVGMTYQRDQEVVGWHRHITDGDVESVASIPSKEVISAIKESEVDKMEYPTDAEAQAAYPVYPRTELDYMEYATNVLAQTAYVSDSGVSSAFKSHWKMNDNAATTVVIDSVGSSAGASQQNTDQLDTTGKINGALTFNGVNDYVNCGQDASLLFVNPMSIAAWVKINNYPTNESVGYTIASNYNNSAYNGFIFSIAGGDGAYPMLRVHDPGPPQVYDEAKSDETLEIGQWYHIVGTVDGTTIKIYVNGVLKDSCICPPTFSGGNAPFSIGNTWSLSGFHLDGDIDDVRFYGLTLTIDEIADIYADGNGTEEEDKVKYLQSYSESTIKWQGSYSLKGIALITESLNDTLTRTVSPTINLSGQNNIFLNAYASRTGNNFKIEFHDSGGNTISHTINIASANTWQTEEIDISAVADADKDAIDQIKITILNADAENIFYLDNIFTGIDLKAYSAYPAHEYERGNGSDGEITLGSTKNINTDVISCSLQCYSEGTIKTEGVYALKILSDLTGSLNQTLTRTVAPVIDLTGKTAIKLDVRASRTGSNFKIEFHDSGGNTISHSINIAAADTFQTDTIDISAVADADKDAIDQIKITVLNADASNIIYVDNVFADAGALTLDLMEYADDAAAQAAYVSSIRTHADGINYDVSALGTDSITASEAPAGIIAGDMVLLMNMRGSSTKYANVGQYETFKVSSIVGDVVNLTTNILKIYGESANSDLTDQKIIVQRVPQYSAVTINSSGKLTASAWNGTKGGIVVLMCAGTVEVKTGGSIDASELGYRGGGKSPSGQSNAYQGEGNKGAGIQSIDANGNGGGGGWIPRYYSRDNASGGSGGHINGGKDGGGQNNWIGGKGGEAVGDTDLEKMFFGGGSGGGACIDGHCYEYGDAIGSIGGGIIYLIIDTVEGAGNIFSKGEEGAGGGDRRSLGGGAGGSILVERNNYDFTGVLSVAGGLAGGEWGPAGSDGRSKTDTEDEEIAEIQSDYSLKVIADQDDSEDGYLLKTFDSSLDLSKDNTIQFYTKSNRVGENFKLQIKSEDTEVVTEKSVNILVADEWQTVEWDISGVAEKDKKDIKWLYVVITNDDAENTFYLDNIIAIGEYISTGEDQIWLAVKRTINGVVKRFIEYLKPQDFGSLEDAFFVDSGLTYEGSPVTTISELSHLIGEEVVILADGLKVAPQTVDASGEITLAVAARKVHAGLAYLPKLQTMNLEAGSATGTAQGKIKRVHEVMIRFKDSVGCKFGYDENNLEDIGGTTLFSGDKIVSFPYGYDRDYFIMITQPDPLPSTIICLCPRLITEDG